MTRYYVDQLNGNDNNNGQTVADAWQSLQYAFMDAASPVAAGDEVVLISDYSIGADETISFEPAGTTLAPIILTGGNPQGEIDGTKPVITMSQIYTYPFSTAGAGNNIIISTLDITANNRPMVYGNGGSYYWHNLSVQTNGLATGNYQRGVFDNIHYQQVGGGAFAGWGGFMARFSCNIVLRNSVFIGNDENDFIDLDSNARGSIWISGCDISGFLKGCNFSSTQTAYYALVFIDRSLIHHCNTGIYTRSPVQIQNTVLADNEEYGLDIYDETIEGTVGVYHSIIANNALGGINSITTGGLMFLREQFNTFYQNTGGDIINGTISPTSENTDPEFVDPANNDYRLKDTSHLKQLEVDMPQPSLSQYMDRGAVQHFIEGNGGNGLPIRIPRARYVGF